MYMFVCVCVSLSLYIYKSFFGSLGKGLGVPHDQWHGMVSCKSYRCCTVSGRISRVASLPVLRGKW